MGCSRYRFVHGEVYPACRGVKIMDSPVLEKLLLQKRLNDSERDHRKDKEAIEALQQQVEEAQAKLGYVLELQEECKSPPLEIKATSGNASESTAVLQASDWHLEETVDSSVVNGLNSFNLRVGDVRIQKFFTNAVKLLNLQRHGTDINTAVLHLGGDHISGYIHSELLENNSLSPTEACLRVLDRLRGGIDYLLNKGALKKLIIVCSIGNHGRTTIKRQISTGYQNSYEWFMYQVLKQFLVSPKIEFRCEPSYHTYVRIYGKEYRFHHGDAFKYGGGVGGITIPVLKKIAQWDKTRRAEIDFFGHFHQFIAHPKFICNGSLIGYGPYSIEIGAEFEEPKQAFCLIEKKRGRTITAPIFLTD